MAELIRDGDGEGYYGSRVEVISPDKSMPDKDRIAPFSGDPSALIGNMLLVGTLAAGTFSSRDWWRTNVITEIISETADEIRFNTESGSTYTLKKGGRR